MEKASRQLEINIPQKIKLEYIIAGKGKPLLFLHGGGTDFRFYQAFINSLAEKYEVYCFSYPGFGKSSQIGAYSIDNFVKVINEFLNYFNIKEVYLVGHSLGAGIALAYGSLDQGKRTKGIAAISPFIFPVKKSIFKMINDLNKQWVIEKNYIPKFNTKKYNLFSFLKYRISHLKYSVNSLRLYFFISKNDLSRYLCKLMVPVVGFYSDHDIVLKPEDQINGLKLIQDIEVFKFEGMGHNAFFPKSKFILEQICKVY